MSVETWGLLEKSQIDSEKIEEAINRLIAAHNADETAHLGSGQSLQSHKAAEIIDHLIGSVVADKLSITEGLLFFPFESFDNYVYSVSGLSSTIGGFRYETGSGTNVIRYLWAPGQYSNMDYDGEHDTVFQFHGRFATGNNGYAYGVAGGDGHSSEPPGIGFKVLNNVLYAVEIVWGGEATEEYTQEIVGVSSTDPHFYRVRVSAADNKAYFYVDNVLVAEFTLHINYDYGLVILTFSICYTGVGNGWFDIGSVYYGTRMID